ncbi:hypothetical protein [Paenibacillus sp. BR1-192]|uniref:hypothetical protein n=1 Tax=Paenibacillus sp. BR1-192 TaxID=3032287 RepID=UPI00240D7138|nr:hypothetical protein [Paenibacillus sp. BR1-192]WFB59687.1 hypothetical protein P0X86_05480 [Paenibacillus sp. BR1-192]
MAVNNVVVKCDVCEIKVLIKFQVGILDQYPVYYSCPSCSTNIYGNILIIRKENRLDFQLHNATYEGGMDGEYILVLSGEFPSFKMLPFTKETLMITSFSPFIRYSPHSDQAKHAYDVLVQLLPSFIDDEWRKIERIANLYFNDKETYLESEIEKLRKSPRIDMSPYEKDSSVSKLVTTIFRSMSSNNPLQNITMTDLDQRLSVIKQTNLNSYEELIQFFSVEDLLYIQKELFSVFNEFANHYRYLSPVVYLEGMGRQLSELENHEGLNTVSFDRLDRLYQNMYETLLGNSTISIMLDNLIVRGAINSMNPSIIRGRNSAGNLQDYISLTKGQKLNYLSDNDNVISHVFAGPLSNDLRNPIGHNSYSYDPNTQLITFRSNRNSQPPRRMYLIEFADKCFQAMKINLMLWDLTVLIKKLIKEEQ